MLPDLISRIARSLQQTIIAYRQSYFIPFLTAINFNLILDLVHRWYLTGGCCKHQQVFPFENEIILLLWFCSSIATLGVIIAAKFLLSSGRKFIKQGLCNAFLFPIAAITYLFVVGGFFCGICG
jgi:hypothetical protein